MQRRVRTAGLAMAGALGLFGAGGSALPVRSHTSSLEEPQAWSSTDSVVFENGRWFDGRRFVPRRVHVVSGRIAGATPSKAHRTVDLRGAYVVPPVGDGHTHVFDGPFAFPRQRSQYLTDGVFYALTTTAPASGVLKIRDRLRGPKNVDVVSAQAGFTGPKSHPAEIYNAYALGIFDWRKQHEQYEMLRTATAAADDAYFVVRTPADLEEKWRLVEKRRPDIIKVFLRASDRYRPEGPPNLADGGMDPALLPLIVKRARAAGLRVAVASSNLADYRATLATGAGVSTHLPCYQTPGGPGPYDDPVPENDAGCLLAPEDGRRAARNKLVSTLITSEWANEKRSATHARWEAANVATLSAAGAPLMIGSNAYGETPVDGLLAAARSRTFTPLRLLRWATMDTPRGIFPDRKVGCLSIGCEASFLVLEGDPLADDLRALKRVRLRVKDGLLLKQAELAAK